VAAMNDLNVMIVGVGGQGTLLTSKIIAAVALKHGRDVKVSEVHGMSQRGGSVVTYVKMGRKVRSPLIEYGEADEILAFEQLEAMRWAGYLKKDGRLIVSEQKIAPMPVITGKEKYPEAVISTIKGIFIDTIPVDALALAKQCGSLKAANTVMIGVMARYTDIPKSYWLEAVREAAPEKLLDVNIKAFETGYAFSASRAV
jgi:indolepyruvate ferredoxin oxidoreductase beta subunit